MPFADADTFDPRVAWQLNGQVSLREETFGALAYHHGTRRLVFLKSPELVALVRSLSDFDCANDALAAHVAVGEYDRYVAALATLGRSEILCARQ